MKDDDNFDNLFSESELKTVEETRKSWFGKGAVLLLLGMILQLLFWGAALAFLLWIAMTILNHFGVLMVMF